MNPIIATPQDVRLVAAGDELRLTWTKPTIGADVTAYQTQLDDEPVQSTQNTWYNRLDLAPGEHTIRVRSQASEGTSGWVVRTVSIPAAGEWPTTVPVPTNVRFVIDMTGFVGQFLWDAPAGEPQVVAFESAVVGSNGSVNPNRGTATSRTLSGTPLGVYTLHLRSVAADGSVSPWVTKTVTFPPSSTPSPTPTVTTTPSSCAVAYSANSWSTGFTASVKLRNTGTAPLTWNLTFDLPAGQKVQQGWSATWSQTGTTVTATGAAWNATLAPGASVDLGFNGSHTGQNTAPTSFAVNGATCAVG